MKGAWTLLIMMTIPALLCVGDTIVFKWDPNYPELYPMYLEIEEGDTLCVNHTLDMTIGIYACDSNWTHLLQYTDEGYFPPFRLTQFDKGINCLDFTQIEPGEYHAFSAKFRNIVRGTLQIHSLDEGAQGDVETNQTDPSGATSLLRPFF